MDYFYDTCEFITLNIDGKILPYGSWYSPVSSELITADSVSLDQVRVHADRLYWIECRPAEQGRNVIVAHHSGNTVDLLPAPFNARSRTHEYGGGAYCVHKDTVYFVNDSDQDVYAVRTGGQPARITNTAHLRFADLVYDTGLNRLLCICEDHGHDTTAPVNSLVAVDLLNGDVTNLHQGHDFYASVKPSRIGNQIAWLCWDHPDMPWDSTELWLADSTKQGQLENSRLVAGGNGISIFQPEWSMDNELYFVSDDSGWWNIARKGQNSIVSVTREQSEFGLPQWVFGQSAYAFINRDHIVCTHISNGIGQLSLLNTTTNVLSRIDTPYNTFYSIAASESSAAIIAASETRLPEIIKIRLSDQKHDVIASSCNAAIDAACLSAGRHFSYKTRHNDEAHAIYYAPKNPDYRAPEDAHPPLIVVCHGGPTGATDTALDLRKQYWTSRGFAMVDVNYSGSTGYGRSYRERLSGNWGLRDVDDVCDAALYLADQGVVDKEKLIIKGSSAGGYTALAALTFHDTFSCGAIYYGISNLESLATDTHKFESRYLDNLIGPYPAQRQKYADRSPINFVEKLRCPVIFFQGLEDKVVPPSQAEHMVSALKHKGVAVSYVTFEHEQHGFRHAENIKKALEAELYFYSRIFGFTPADKLEPVPIDNL